MSTRKLIRIHRDRAANETHSPSTSAVIMPPKKLIRGYVKDKSSGMGDAGRAHAAEEMPHRFFPVAGHRLFSLAGDGTFQSMSTDSSAQYAGTNHKLDMTIDAYGLQQKLHPDAVTAELSDGIDTSNQAVSHQLQSKAVTLATHNPNLFDWQNGVAILALVLIVILCLLCCYLKGKRWICIYLESKHKTNDKARLALLQHHQDASKPSFQIFLELSEIKAGPAHKKWCDALRSQSVANRIDVVFDALQSVQSFGSNDVMKWLGRCEFQLGSRNDENDEYRAFHRPEVEEHDLEWLFKSWDEIYPSQLGREAFQDLFKLVITWIRARSFQFLLLTRQLVPPNLPGLCNWIRVEIPNDREPVTILKHEFPPAFLNFDSHSQTAIEEHPEEREFVPGKSEHDKKKRYRRGSAAALLSQAGDQTADGARDRSQSLDRGRGTAEQMRQWYPRARSRSRSEGPGDDASSPSARPIASGRSQSRSPSDPPASRQRHNLEN